MHCVQREGDTLWLPVEDELYLIDQAGGSEVRRLPLCKDFTRPVYDGVNVWTSCPENGELHYFPVRMQYFGVERFDGDMYLHVPVEHSGALWLSQEDSGRVLAYNPGLPPLIETIGTPLMPLQADGEFLWTAVPPEGRLIRLRPQVEPANLLQPQPVTTVIVDEVNITGEIHSFSLIGNYVWVLHTRPDQLREAANLTIVNRLSLKTQEHVLATIPASLAYLDERVWVSASGLRDDIIYVFDPVTGETLNTLSLPDTDFASWSPVQISRSLYFTAGAPPLSQAGPYMIDVFIDSQRPLATAPLLFEYDLDAEEWSTVHEIVPAPYAPLNADPFLWFLSGYVPNDMDRDNGIIIALNPQTNATVGPYTPCPNAALPSATEKFVFVGCQLPDSHLTIFDRQTGQEILTYEEVGSDPWPPVEHGGLIWLTFRESNNAVVFDSDTAALIGIFPLGAEPGPPFMYNNDVWVMNSAEGSMQRLRVEQQP